MSRGGSRTLGRAAAALIVALGAALAAGGGAAETRALGPETNLPLPRFVSLKAEKANIRRGPGLTHRIDWVFVRRGMPLEIIAEHGHWRKVRDVDAATGWVHHAMLRGARSAVVLEDRAAFRAKPEPGARINAFAEAGVIVEVDACERDWCAVVKDGHKGWTLKSALWGAGGDEVFD